MHGRLGVTLDKPVCSEEGLTFLQAFSLKIQTDLTNISKCLGVSSSAHSTHCIYIYVTTVAALEASLRVNMLQEILLIVRSFLLLGNRNTYSCLLYRL